MLYPLSYVPLVSVSIAPQGVIGNGKENADFITDKPSGLRVRRLDALQNGDEDQ